MRTLIYRRLYLILPDADHARRTVSDLFDLGLDQRHIRSYGRDRNLLLGLPRPSTLDDDRQAYWEGLAWRANLGLFFAAALSLPLILAASGWSAWLMLPLLLMGASLAAGLAFTHVPNTHLRELRDCVAHGEILLAVDVRREREAQIEDRLQRQHPELVIGGVGWGSDLVTV